MSLTGRHLGSRNSGLGDDEASLDDASSSGGQYDRVTVYFSFARVFVHGIHECRPNDDQDICKEVPGQIMAFLSHHRPVEKRKENKENHKW